MSDKQVERNEKILRLYNEEGLATTEIAERFGMTRQRVHQIIKPRVVKAHYGIKKMKKLEAERRVIYDRIVAGELSLREAAYQIKRSPNQLRLYFRERGWLLPKYEAPLHGTRYRYQQGCKCDECKKAAVDYQKRYQDMTPTSHDYSGYTNYGCRCDICREAARVQNRKYQQTRKEKLLQAANTS